MSKQLTAHSRITVDVPDEPGAAVVGKRRRRGEDACRLQRCTEGLGGNDSEIGELGRVSHRQHLNIAVRLREIGKRHEGHPRLELLVELFHDAAC